MPLKEQGFEAREAGGLRGCVMPSMWCSGCVMPSMWCSGGTEEENERRKARELPLKTRIMGLFWWRIVEKW